MRRFLAACLLLLLVGCVDTAKDLLDTAQWLQGGKDYRYIFQSPPWWPAYSRLQASSLMPIRWQIVENYPDSPYANRAKTRLAELEKAR